MLVISYLSTNVADEFFFVGCRTFFMKMNMFDVSCYVITIKESFSAKRTLKKS